MRVLLLTAAYGEGHNAAARGLHAAFAEMGVEVETVDLFANVGGAFYEYSRRSYGEVINRAPRLWAAVFALIHRFPLVRLSLPLLGALRRELAAILAARPCNVVVSVYPVYGYLLEKLYPCGTPRPFAFHTVITDSITINSVWYSCRSDTFLVPNEQTAAVLRSAGIPSPRIHPLGFPVPPCFANPSSSRATPAPDHPPRVLYMVNAGKRLAAAIVAQLLGIPALHLTVTVGRDETLRAQVEDLARAAGRTVEIHGWTDRMPELVMSHHVLIGKAGGAAVQEAIAARTPMIITQIVPGQEEGNAQLLFENVCGALCQTPEAITAKIRALFAEDAALWRQWETNMARLSRPDAARDVARFVLSGKCGGSPAIPAEESICGPG